MKTMKAVVFKGKDRIALEEVPKPSARAGEAVIRITTTTICGTDAHIVRGEYPVQQHSLHGTATRARKRHHQQRYCDH
jgi:alcohol dehydrogenase